MTITRTGHYYTATARRPNGRLVIVEDYTRPAALRALFNLLKEHK